MSLLLPPTPAGRWMEKTMTDFESFAQQADEPKYSAAAIRAAMQSAAESVTSKTVVVSPDAVIAALENPAPKFREGEVVWSEGLYISLPAPEKCGNWIHRCRHLRLSEMPQAVEDLRRGAIGARGLARDILEDSQICADRARALYIINALNIDGFDEVIEP